MALTEQTRPAQDAAAEDRALLALLRRLAAQDYRFVTPTPATHGRVVARPGRRRAADLRDVLGWSLPFEPALLDPDLLALMVEADMVERREAGELASRMRVSSVGETLYLHSAYPTTAEDAVFFGPDSYRFATFIAAELAEAAPVLRVVDVGAGAGVGGIVAGRLRPGAQVLLTDVNDKALRLARINAEHAGVTVATQLTEGLKDVDGAFDLVLTNPPYIIDAQGRAYRDGGDMHGARIAFDLAVEAAGRLAPGGRLLLYTGSPIIDGRDPLREALAPRLAAEDCELQWRELDPDVFGEELEAPAYGDVERIAVIGAVATRRA